MKGINKVIIVGTCGKDPETRYTPSGTAITSISMATSEQWKDKQTGGKQERTEWHNIVFFGRLAEIAGEYLAKGSRAYVEGSLTTEKWTDKSGNDRYTTKIKANEMQLLGNMQQSGSNDSGQRSQPAPEPAPGGGDNAFDDDIPF